MPVRIKICGITRPQDAVLAARLGADALGMVFYPDSARAVSLEQAQTIARAVSAFVTLTALFLDPEKQVVEKVLDTVPVNLLQFHGSEPGSFCRQFGRPYIKAVAMQDSAAAMAELQTEYADAAGLVFDSHAAGAAGGTGQTFDWSRLQSGSDNNLPIILAGGLTPDNVATAIRQVRPWAVDVASGVESSPGVKDADKLERFITEVRNAS
ncbi:MAG TPA: phosphoribosylanthranilate isomerase [Gammaproteobacteria bacterium]|nr:phosphoribosylanthranilate isomerase [Gammaproteobacteria bacterium]